MFISVMNVSIWSEKLLKTNPVLFANIMLTQTCPTHLTQCFSAAVKQISRDQDGFYITAGSTQRDHMFPP